MDGNIEVDIQNIDEQEEEDMYDDVNQFAGDSGYDATPISKDHLDAGENGYVGTSDKQGSVPQRNRSRIKKESTLSAIKNQLDLTMSQYGSMIRENINSRLPCIDDESCDENELAESSLQF